MFEKDKELSKLLVNPDLTSDWIGAAMNLMEHAGDLNITVENLIAADLTAMQLTMIGEIGKQEQFNSVKKAYEFVKTYEFNDSQLQVILKALENKISVEDILDTVGSNDTPYAVMNWLLAGVAEGYDQFKDPIYRNYHPDQIQEVFSGLKDGINVSDYDDVTVSSEMMQVIRHARCVGLTVTLDKEKKELTIY